ncbi:metalloregulator ArsR/SmtB family transcription factor [Asticcacaulis sp. ZE23SCel15]|uniref:ArsR/SmtB family transcription factor n=1 Tax=Asticcacaulis sp. ZE23SCel15 TaxID=3059027 RepID=UPI0026601A49|nr:metalloregulator ArsR/SmtB family transcription factor [Asticcacaulis sp. ZE23SCel15]WKL58973.1 metalloregulator ArsR/SmtB family transcription factor [Asticcacaulis sp. ZE23SCel15]
MRSKSNPVLGAAALLEALKAAGEPTRLRLLRLLADEELSVMELVQILNQSQPRVSRHLKLMSEAGLIDRFPDGAWVFYRASDAPAIRPLVTAVLDALGDDYGDDVRALDDIHAQRLKSAQSYFENIAGRWDEIRSHHISEADVEAAIVGILGDQPFDHLVDLGTGSGRMLTLLGPRAKTATGLDLSQQMLNIARARTAESGLTGDIRIDFRHGDIADTRLSADSADLVIVHQVLHFLPDPVQAVREAGRILKSGGRLLVVDFAPHGLEHMREQYQHRRLGISDEDMSGWLMRAGLTLNNDTALPPVDGAGLTVRIWLARKD